MLRLRVITGVILASVIVGAVLALDTAWLGVLLGAITLIGAWEWADLSGVPGWPGRAAYLAGLLALAGLLLAYVPSLAVLVLAAGWWLAVAWRIALGRPAPVHAGAVSGAWLVAGPLTLLPAYVAMLSLHASEGAVFLLYALGTVWVADIGAYFAGRRWGRRKLAPAISPGKTWEGVAGAAALVAVYGALGAWLLGFGAAAGVVFVALVLLAGAASVVGDLFESLLKRAAERKDSGRLLPGHGGVLDRIDSLTAAAPVLALGSALLARA